MRNANAESENVLACWTSGPMDSWPEKSTRLSGFPVMSAKAIARPPTARATIGTTTKGRTSVAAFTVRPIRTMTKTATATPAASRIVHPNAASVGVWYFGRVRGAMAYALALRPVTEPMPMNTSEPIPAANNPGSRTMGRVAPPRPAASMMMTAPTIGDPKREEMAAKLAAAAIRPRT